MCNHSSDCIDNSDIHQRAISGLIWQFVQKGSTQFVTFIVGIILARILTPADYGIVAIVTVFTSILNVFIDCGMSTVLIQKGDADELDYSTLFYFNLVVCILSYFALFLTAPLVASFYHKDQLISLIRVLGATLLFSGFNSVQTAFYRKHLLFKDIFHYTIVASVLSAVVGVSMAFKGFGAWSLVWMTLVNNLIQTVIMWYKCQWAPRIMFSMKCCSLLFKQGIKLLCISLISNSYGDICQLLIGKVYSSADLAYYNKSSVIPRTILNNTLYTIDGVMFPVMCKVNDDRQQVLRIMRETMIKSSFFVWPCLTLIGAGAESIIVLLYGDKWLPAAIFMRIYCLGYFFHTINCANLDAIKALRQNTLLVYLEVVKKLICFSLLLLCYRHSVIMLAIGIAVSNILCQFVNTWPNKKLLDYGYLQQVKDLFPLLLASILMGGCTFLISFLKCHVCFVFILQTLIGGTLYLLFVRFICPKLLYDNILFLKNQILHRFKNKNFLA